MINFTDHSFPDGLRESLYQPLLLLDGQYPPAVLPVTGDQKEATQKAKAMLAAAVKRVPYHEPLGIREVPVDPAALVVATGIAGIEAARRTDDSGGQICLVEREPSIGGHMAQLSKTCPSHDCSARIPTPWMVLVGRHGNIQLLSYSEVEEVSGCAGDLGARSAKNSATWTKKGAPAAACTVSDASQSTSPA